MIADYTAPFSAPRPGLSHPVRLMLLVALLLGLCWAGLGGIAYGSGGGPSSATVTIHQGDTLWTIAAARYPGDDTRARVDEIMALNDLQSPTLHAGESLVLPSS